MEITSAEFVISNTDVKKCPPGIFPEYAFIGRSNVGKSSLINMMTGRKGLAMTSATPGKTMLINHFLINKSWYIVDLPGYGYARRGQKGKSQIQRIIEDYILERERRQIEQQYPAVSEKTKRAMGRTSPIFCDLF